MNLKVPYKLEVWDEEFVQDEEFSDCYWHEKCLVQLASDEMEFQGKAYNIQLSKNMNGEIKLSFSLNQLYIDNQTGEKTKNYLADYLFNEAKIKLKYDNQWYDFVVKSISDSHNDKLTSTYTCQQLATYELSKIGYNITFSLDDARGSAVQSAGAFMTEILDGTEWNYIEAGSASPVTNMRVDLCEYAKEITYMTRDAQSNITYYDYTINNGVYSRGAQHTKSSGYIFIPYSQIKVGQGNDIFVYISDTQIIDVFDGNLITRDQLKVISAPSSWSNITPTKYSAETPQKSLESKFISYTDYQDSSNSISQFCNKFIYNANQVGYYRDITQNLNWGYKVTDDTTPTAEKVYYQRRYLMNGNVSYTAFYNLSNFSTGDFTWCERDSDAAAQVQNLSGLVRTVRQYFSITEVNNVITATTLLGYGAPSSNIFYKKDDNGTYYYNEKTGEYSITSSGSTQKYSQVTMTPSYSFNMYRTLEASRSNCFNLTQDVAEVFEVWARYIIEYNDDGSIQLDSNNRRKKWVTLVSNYGKSNDVGFTYGLNTSSIQRSIDSNKVATKIYIEDCENSSVSDGVISISYAEDNISKENFIINFDYFIQAGLLDASQVSLDLYNIGSSSFNILTGTSYLSGNSNAYGYLRHLGVLNDEYDTIYNKIMGSGENSLSNLIIKYQALYNAYNTAVNTANGTLTSQEGSTYEAAHAQDIAVRNEYNSLLTTTKNKLNSYTAHLDSIVTRKKELNTEFNKKYSRFIQEGNWSGNSYVSHDAYYNDALKVSYDSARPAVSYTINALELSLIPGYEMFKYDVGDISWIEDTDYFGYQNDGRPYHEKVVVKEISYELDNPSSTKITIANYSNDFEDLFQKLNATVQSYQFNQSTYQRASNLTSSGAMEYTSLQDSFNKNKSVTFIDNDVVTTDNNGITIKNAADPNKIVRLVSGGIVLSSDGGENYTTGIYAGEINTSLIKSGTISTENLTIQGGTTDTTQLTIHGAQITATKGNETIFSFDNNGNLTLNGSIAKYESGHYSDSPQYYIGVDDLSMSVQVGPKYTKTLDSSKTGTKKYYYLSNYDYMAKLTYDNLSDDDKKDYIFDGYYTYTSSRQITQDTTPKSGKTYYYKDSNGNWKTFTEITFTKYTDYYEDKYSYNKVSSLVENGYVRYQKYTEQESALLPGVIYYETNATIAKKDWRLLLGDHYNNHSFGVDSNGELYASKAVFYKNVYADGGFFNNVTINDTCTVKGQSISGEINGDKVSIDGGNALQYYSTPNNNISLQIGQGSNAITVKKDGTLSIPRANYAYSCNTAGGISVGGSRVKVGGTVDVIDASGRLVAVLLSGGWGS